MTIKDFFGKVVKRWRLVAIVYAVTVAGAFLVTMVSPKVYEVKSALKIGRLPDLYYEAGGILVLPRKEEEETRRSVESTGEVIEKITIKSDYKLDVKPYDEEPTISVRAETSDPQKVKRELIDVEREIVNEHGEIVDQEKNRIDSKKEELESTIAWLKEKNHARGIADLQIRVQSLQNQIDMIEKTEVIEKPTVSKKPIKPNLKNNLFLGSLLGLGLSLEAVFLVEKTKRKERN